MIFSRSMIRFYSSIYSEFLKGLSHGTVTWDTILCMCHPILGLTQLTQPRQPFTSTDQKWNLKNKHIPCFFNLVKTKTCPGEKYQSDTIWESNWKLRLEKWRWTVITTEIISLTLCNLCNNKSTENRSYEYTWFPFQKPNRESSRIFFWEYNYPTGIVKTVK